MPRNASVSPAEIMQSGPSPAASQGTVIEQTRAVAEVQAMVIVAQQAPRSIPKALDGMREVCAQPALAQRAFWRFPRAGQQLTGSSIHLARELARCWGNIAYGVTELRRDEVRGVSEMQAYAWDVQTNTRTAQIFIVPHVKDTRDGAKAITDMRDVYENNANLGARRVRECIFAVLPSWYVQEAEERCRATLSGGGEKPLPQRIGEAVNAFAALGVTVDQLEKKLSVQREKWEGPDLAQLEIIFRSIKNGEVTVNQEFPPRRTTAEDVLGEPDEKPARQTRKTGRNWDADLANSGGDMGALEALYRDALQADAPAEFVQKIESALEGAGA